MLKHRGFIFVGLLVLTCAGAALGLTSLWWNAPFDPSTASQRQLLRWLALHDVSQQSPEVQTALVDRLAGEIRAGIDAQPPSGEQNAYHQQLWKNADFLKRRWFILRSEQYDQLPPDRRQEFLDTEIATVFAWASLEARWSPGGDSSESAAAFIEEIETWIAEEQDPQLKSRMVQVIHDGIVRWLATRDLSDQSMATRRLLVRRIAYELDHGTKASDVANDRPPEEAAQLHANAMLLTEAWLHEQADAYAQIEKQHRAAFIDDQIEKVQRWGVLEMASHGDSTNATADPTAAFAGFAAKANQWIQRAEPEDQPRLKKLLSDVQGRIFLRMLQGTLFPKG